MIHEPDQAPQCSDGTDAAAFKVTIRCAEPASVGTYFREAMNRTWRRSQARLTVSPGSNDANAARTFVFSSILSRVIPGTLMSAIFRRSKDDAVAPSIAYLYIWCLMRSQS